MRLMSQNFVVFFQRFSLLNDSGHSWFSTFLFYIHIFLQTSLSAVPEPSAKELSVLTL